MDFLSFVIEKKITPRTRNLFILPHQGLGDQVAIYGYVAEMLKKYEIVVLVVKTKIIDTLHQLYSNLNIIFYGINDDKDISPNFGYVEKDALFSLLQQFNFDHHFHYCHSLIPLEPLKTTIWTFIELFYREFGLDEKLRYNFSIERNLEREQQCFDKLVSVMGDKYAIIHDDNDRNFLLNGIFMPDLPKFFIGLGTHVNDELKSNNVFDYIKVLESAEEIHIFDSFLAIMIDVMNLKCKGKIYFHTYLRDGDPRLYRSDFVYL
jgi:hypothetical protein